MSNYSIQQRSEQFKALGNPHRLALFQRLATCCVPGTICNTDDVSCFSVGALGEGLDIAPSTLSHHLKELHRAGLIMMRRQGKNVECWIEPAVLDAMSRFFTAPNTLEK